MDVTVSKTTLANYAGSKIGAKNFNFGDGSSSDKSFSIVYDPVREYCLEECPWTFATKTVALTTLSLPSTQPELNFGDGIKYAYSFPSDYLKCINFNFPQAYIVQGYIQGIGPVILSDTAGLIMKYVFNNDDPTSYSGKFYEAMACRLAWAACFKLVEAAQYKAEQSAEYERAFLTAACSDGQNISPEVVNQGFWEWARLAGSNGAVGDPPGSLNVGWAWPGSGGG